MGCVQGSLGNQLKDKKQELPTEIIQQEQILLQRFISKESNENAGIAAEIIIKTLQQVNENRQYLQKLLKLKFDNSQCQEDKDHIAFLIGSLSAKLNPKNKQSYLNVADIFEILQKFQEIVPLLETGHKNIPQDMEIIQKICDFSESVNRYDKAAEFYEKLIILQPDKYQHYYSYARNDLQSDNYHIGKSEDYLFEGAQIQKIIQGGKRSHQYYYAYAYLFYRVKRLKLAEEVVKISINLDKPFLPSYYLCQKICKALFLKQAEKDVILKMVNIWPHSKRAQNQLANYYWGQEEYDNAAKIVQQILKNQDDSQIIDTSMVAKVYNHTGSPKKAEQYLFSLLKRCRSASQAHPIYLEIINMHSFNQNWQMAYQYSCIRDKETQRALSNSIQLARFCLRLNKNQQFLQLIDEIQRKIGILQRRQIIQFMEVLRQAKRYDQCLYVYDTQFIASKTKLKRILQAKINIIMADCFYQLGKMDQLMEIVAEIQVLVKLRDRWPVSQIIDYMDICSRLWKYERLKYFYDVFVLRVNRMQINGYRWGELCYQEILKKYREILLEEKLRVSSTPQ